MKNAVAKMIAKSGYRLSKNRPNTACLFDELCLYHLDNTVGLERHFLDHILANAVKSRSQRFQDLMADFFTGGGQGVFCEFGATDGVELSNSYFLENDRGWTGILAEPGQSWHAALFESRKSATIDTRCVYSKSGESVQFSEADNGVYSTISDLAGQDAHQAHRAGSRQYEVETISLNDLLDEHKIEKLDFLSVDTEGSEFEILKAFDFQKFLPAIIAVEHNFTEQRLALNNLITRHGYIRIFEEFSSYDDWYVQPILVDKAMSKFGLSVDSK